MRHHLTFIPPGTKRFCSVSADISTCEWLTRDENPYVIEFQEWNSSCLCRRESRENSRAYYSCLTWVKIRVNDRANKVQIKSLSIFEKKSIFSENEKQCDKCIGFFFIRPTKSALRTVQYEGTSRHCRNAAMCCSFMKPIQWGFMKLFYAIIWQIAYDMMVAMHLILSSWGSLYPDW